MRLSVSLAVASLGVLVAFSNHLGAAEASLSAPQADLARDEGQVGSEGVFAQEAGLRLSGRRGRTVALVSLIAVSAAVAFAVYKCFRGRESKGVLGEQRVARRRHAEEGDASATGAAAPGDGEFTEAFSFFGDIPVKYGPNKEVEELLVTLEGGRFFLNHPITGEHVPLTVKWEDGVGPMLHDAATGNTLEWLLVDPIALMPKDVEVEEGEALEGGVKAEAVANQSKEPERVPPQSREHPYIVFISGIPVKLNKETGGYEEILLSVDRGGFVFSHPTLRQPVKVSFRDGDLYSAEGLNLKGIVDEIKQKGTPTI
ncbi:hypothetical protein EPH_0020290 [Eimeria praecox]|uniref:Transmembrane protein n=1 Tax=Eimeria praecox TaxID=51316 RepID=U6H1S8_9EIME|nr:hypothetical protein EPH_0020290 [Eimeria praecox]